MKTIAFIALLLITTFYASAEDVKLKITYKGDGLKAHTVTVMLGDAALGSGVTDSDGEVTISVSSLPTKSIDLKGEKTCEGARKSWSASGYVTLDGSNYAHLKMEDLVSEMVEASGGMMSESMLVASYGLVCSGSSGDSGDSGDSASEETGTTTIAENPGMSREEMQANQKQGLENKIASIENKIERKQSKIDSGKFTDDKKVDAEQDIRELEIEKQITQNKLDKLNMQMEKGMLNKSERRAFKEKEDALKDELKAVKNGESSSSDSKMDNGDSKDNDVTEEDASEEAASEYVISEQDLADMSNNDLKKRKIGLKSDLSKKKLKLKTRKNALSPNELAALEQEIATIEKSIEVIDAELEKR
ncbi:MAG: hypothetical protein ACFHU9_00805 [Fluviicola sp.]